MNRRRSRGARRAVVAVAAVLATGAGAAAATGFRLAGAQSGGGTEQDLPPATAKVTRQSLVDTQSETGTLAHGDTSTLSGRIAGTLTWVPSVGSTVQRGQRLYTVDNLPVELMYGSLPAYRALAPGTTGADVKQFEQNLYALGYRGFTVDDTYNSATAAAVKRWQGDLGLPETGTVDLGRVVYAAGAIRVDTAKAAQGDAMGPGAPVYQYTGTAPQVSVQMDISEQSLAAVGAAVSIQLPNGTTVGGKIVERHTVVVPAEGANPATTKLAVTISVDDPSAVTAFDQASVTVAFTASKRDDVLTVPVAALLALAEGGYGVQVVQGGTTRIVAVQIGLFASGRVEVTGTGLTEGMTVGMPS